MDTRNDNENSVLDQLRECLDIIDKTENLYIAADDLKRFHTTMLMILTPNYLKKEDAKGLQQLLNNENEFLSDKKIFEKRKTLQDSREKILNYIDQLANEKNPKNEHIINSVYTINAAMTILNELTESKYLYRQLDIHNNYNLVEKLTRYIADEKLAEPKEMLVSQTPMRKPMGQPTPTRQPMGQSTPTRKPMGQSTPTRQPMGQSTPPVQKPMDAQNKQETTPVSAPEYKPYVPKPRVPHPQEHLYGTKVRTPVGKSKDTLFPQHSNHDKSANDNQTNKINETERPIRKK